MATKKISELTAVTSVLANTLVVVVDSSGTPTTAKIQFKDVVNSIPSNASFSANVSVLGSLTANAVSATGNVSFNSANFTTANNLLLKKTTTPANTTDVTSSSTVGQIWSDGSYLYFQANATHLKRVAISTW